MCLPALRWQFVNGDTQGCIVPVQCAVSDEVCALSYSLLHGSFGEDKHWEHLCIGGAIPSGVGKAGELNYMLSF